MPRTEGIEMESCRVSDSSDTWIHASIRADHGPIVDMSAFPIVSDITAALHSNEVYAAEDTSAIRVVPISVPCSSRPS